nr:indolepyruvate ferredoxin oxidoreductase subunit alpha [bacterium]
MKKLMLGNQALAQGAWEAGCRVVSSYPGTPSTEITEFASKYPEIYTEWAANEKVALEVALGAAVGGARAMCCMKHVGLNVAADPLFTAAYTGVNAGLVIVVADDPGMHSSQNEQDSRFYARSAHIPMLEPSDSDEARWMVGRAFELSEQFDTPVIVRMVTRIAHGHGLVEVGPRREVPVKPYEKNIPKYVMMPAMARSRHIGVEKRENRLTAELAELGLNRVEMNDLAFGVVTSSTCYQYVKEMLPEASVYKLDMVYPLPVEDIRKFASQVGRLVVIEELEPFIEDTLKAAGIACEGKKLFSRQGELSARMVGKAFGVPMAPEGPKADFAVPVRPPIMCPGCPHRGTYYAIKKLGLSVTGDIGCYTLGAAAPLSAIDSCVCMGASINMSHGMGLARPEDAKKWVAVIGDSTFFHSGMTGLASAVYNKSKLTLVVLDNRTTGMTGHQDHPGTGKTAKGEETVALDIETVARALGVKDVFTANPLNPEDMEQALRAAVAVDGVSVVIAKEPCIMLTKARKPSFESDGQKCKNCGMCLKIGCPAIEKREKGVWINPALCTGCGLCAKLCRFGALGGQNHE